MYVCATFLSLNCFICVQNTDLLEVSDHVCRRHSRSEDLVHRQLELSADYQVLCCVSTDLDV